MIGKDLKQEAHRDMAIKNIAGQAVRDKNFFERRLLLRKLEQKIDSGSSILISAPRRVGKTSLMFYLHDLGMEGYHFIYLITESVNNENEYFKRILHKVLDSEFFSGFQKYSKQAYRLLKDRANRITEIGSSVKFDKKSTVDYKQEFINTIKPLELEGQKIVLMIDEFSQTLENIIDDEGKSSAVHFLQSNRELRQDPDINQKMQFIFAGSIGLENIVNRLNTFNLINDLDTLKVSPLTSDEAHRLMMELVEGKPFILSKANRENILKRIQWYIPFYIQLAVMEITGISMDIPLKEGEEKIKVSKKIIDSAFDAMLEHRGSFEHWHTRLRKALKKEEYTFAKELLNLLTETERESIDKNELFNLAQKLEAVDSYKDIINILIYDGYINNNDDPDTLRFNSPLLKIWWRKNVAY
jgi:uncharacterized protein